ncbi:MAG TPA: DUF3237 family protein, partial [Propionibacteriaceae bacterium]|nr:DUF3237 family protein [Propionibacteriaceae bacterium]
THPLQPTVGAPFGAKKFWQVSEATLDGARIKAHLAGAGLDWISVSSDGYRRPDVHAQFLTDDAEVILMHYTGQVQQTGRFCATTRGPPISDRLHHPLVRLLHTAQVAALGGRNWLPRHRY